MLWCGDTVLRVLSIECTLTLVLCLTECVSQKPFHRGNEFDIPTAHRNASRFDPGFEAVLRE